MDIDVERQHVARLALLDLLLPADPPLSGDLIHTVGALGPPAFHEADPETLDATWGPLRRHTLTVRLAGADLGPLLGRWKEHLAKLVTPGDEDCAAQISWPSRDTSAVIALIHHGFAPLVTPPSAAPARSARPRPFPASPSAMRRRRTCSVWH